MNELFFIILLVICVIVYISNKRNKSKNIYTSEYRYKPSKSFIYKSEYDRLLQDERWKNKRSNILNRDNHKCQWCGKTTDLQIHHKYYNVYPDGNKANPWDYPDDALMTLCDDCHKKYHNKYKVKTYYRKRYKHFE